MNEKYLEFCINNYSYVGGSAVPDIDFVPKLMRRRLTLLDKYTLSVINSCYSEDVENLIFSSKYGQSERLLNLIAQYTHDKEVSPAAFSGSVHNYPLGLFLLISKNKIPYTALSAVDDSFQSGLIASVIAPESNVLFCYADTFEESNTSAIALNISKSPVSKGRKFILYQSHNPSVKHLNLADFVSLVCDEKDKFYLPKYTIERIS